MTQRYEYMQTSGPAFEDAVGARLVAWSVDGWRLVSVTFVPTASCLPPNTAPLMRSASLACDEPCDDLTCHTSGAQDG
jgi:hypothetical protein